MTRTSKGLELRLTFHEQDPNDSKGLERGFVVHRVNAHVGDAHVGYLKISYVSSALLPKVFPTLWHWTATQGWCFNPKDPVATWFMCHMHMRRVPRSLSGTMSSYLSLSAQMYPGDTMAAKDLKALEHVGHRGHRSVKAWFADWHKLTIDRPWVDYIRVEPEWQRQGIAAVLYEASARWLAETKGFPLWASSLQTPEAVATWQAIRHTLPVREADRGDGTMLPLIDFRSAEP